MASPFDTVRDENWKRKMSKSITPTQMAVIEHCKTYGGRLYRHPGGLWAATRYESFDYMAPHFRTKVVMALVAAGLFRVAETKTDFFGRKLDVEVELT